MECFEAVLSLQRRRWHKFNNNVLCAQICSFQILLHQIRWHKVVLERSHLFLHSFLQRVAESLFPSAPVLYAPPVLPCFFQQKNKSQTKRIAAFFLDSTARSRRYMHQQTSPFKKRQRCMLPVFKNVLSLFHNLLGYTERRKKTDDVRGHTWTERKGDRNCLSQFIICWTRFRIRMSSAQFWENLMD